MLPKRLEDDLSNVPRYKPEKFNIDKFLADSEESALFDKVFGIRSVKRDKEDMSSNSEFTTLLSSRLVTVEQENKELRRQLAEKTSKIVNLEEERAQLLELLKSENRNADHLKSLKCENRRLQQQILEMEQFLADYGLAWVGNRSEVQDSHSSQTELNYELFLERIAELNSLVLSEPAQVVTSTDGNRVRARLAHADQRYEHIPVTIYKNGLMIKRGPFRELGSDSYNSFVGDVLDGYFPSEFRGDNPDGVILKVTDRRTETFQMNTSSDDHTLSSAQFLNRLPKTVLKDGNIIPVRDDIADRFGFKASPHDSAGMAGKKVICLRTNVQETIENGGELVDTVATVQIKWAIGTGSVTYILKVYASNMIADLRHELYKEKGKEVESIRFRASHPPRFLEDCFTILECGLVPNGTIHVEKV